MRLRNQSKGPAQDIVLLRELRKQVPGAEQSRIDDLLANVVDDVADAASTLQLTPEKHDEEEAEPEGSDGEAGVSAEVGSNADLDLVDEDLLENESARATGFIGKSSEIQWIRKLHMHGVEQNHDGPYGPPGQTTEAAAERLAALRHRQGKYPTSLMQTSKASFYLDDEEFALEVDLDPLELPPLEIAEKLLQTYMESCHAYFPFLAKKSFTKQFNHYYGTEHRGNTYELPKKWQAQLNLVFAIGAAYSHFILADWRGDERDHLLYHARAWALSLKDPWWISQPDLPQMQITGLFAFYYLSIGHINRSWILIGLAMRFGYALGLHIRNEDRSAGAAKKELLSRIWWSHYTLESTLAVLTGRPSLRVDKGCSVPLPLPISSEEIDDSLIESRFGDKLAMSASLLPRERNVTASSSISPSQPTRAILDYHPPVSEPANSGSYLRSVIKLGETTHAALNLYASGSVGESWQSVQKLIEVMTEEIEIWATSLPDGLIFSNREADLEHPFKREQNTLAFLYHSTRILITRPCLCRLDRRITRQSATSKAFNQSTALTCLESAKSIARLLPDDPELDHVQIYMLGPWWIMVHSIMQSLVVLILDMSYEAQHFPDDPQEILAPLKKLIRWLRALRLNNAMARRAYSIVVSLLNKVAKTVKIYIADILDEDPEAIDAEAAGSSLPPNASDHTIPHLQTETPEHQPDQHQPGQQRGSTPLTFHTQAPIQNESQYIDPQSIGMQYQPTFDVAEDPQHRSFYSYPAAESEYMDWAAEWGIGQESGYLGLFYTNYDDQHPVYDDEPLDFSMGEGEAYEGADQETHQ